MSYTTILKNDSFIIVDKNANVLSVPSRLGSEDSRPCLGHILQNELKTTIYPVHRLDYEVQGLIMYALTPNAQRAGNSWFENKTISKTYSALSKASGAFKVGESHDWKCKLLRGKKRAYESPHGKESLTVASLKLIDDQNISHWELNPITGRSHQLRYELFRQGEVILGDTLYGAEDSSFSPGIALRAFEIDFSKIKNREEFSLPEKILIKSF